MAQIEIQFEAEQRRIPGYGGTKKVAHYSADALGVVRSHWNNGKVVVLRQDLGTRGRLQVGLFNATGNHTLGIHRVVALAFLGPCPEGAEVSHLNGCCLDNRLENLCYESHSDNAARREEHGTMPRGEAHGGAKLTAAEAIEIYRLVWDGDLTHREIAERFGVTRQLVSCIKHGRVWADTTGHKKAPLRKPKTRAQRDRYNEWQRARRKAKTAARRAELTSEVDA